jgi:F420-dependent oxidoreductase-like protein
VSTLKLGLQLGYWGANPPNDVAERVEVAERSGFDSVWTAEAYGSDALTPLSWIGSRTRTLRLGTALCQLSARTPTATAMAAITLDHLSNGRFVLGLGVSGPQVVEGWYGQSFDRPLARTVEYVDIVRKVVKREAPVTSEGPFYPLPYSRGTGLGRPMKSIVHPLRDELPIILGAEGPRNIALTAEIADGWFPLFFSPHATEVFAPALAEGFARPGARCTADEFEVIANAPVIIADNIEDAADRLRPSIALYIGGMGARSANFHFDLFTRMGYGAEAVTIQELFLAGQVDKAIAAVPTSLVDDISLIGSKERIRDGLEAWRESVATTLVISGSVEILQTMAELTA